MRHLCRRTTPSRLSCDADNKGQRVVRGEAVGAAGCAVQRVRMGLGTTCSIRPLFARRIPFRLCR